MLLLLSTTLLIGCNVSYRADTTLAQATEKRIKATDEQDAQTTIAQLKEDLRLANERAKLAEEKAALEKRKRESAEERLKQLNPPDPSENDEEHSEDKGTSGS